MQFAPQQQPQVLPRTSTPSKKNLHRPLQARGSSTLLLRPCARMPSLLHAMAGAIHASPTSAAGADDAHATAAAAAAVHAYAAAAAAAAVHAHAAAAAAAIGNAASVGAQVDEVSKALVLESAEAEPELSVECRLGGFCSQRPASPERVERKYSVPQSALSAPKGERQG